LFRKNCAWLFLERDKSFDKASGSTLANTNSGSEKDRPITYPLPANDPEVCFQVFKALFPTFSLCKFELIKDQDAYEKSLMWFLVVKDNQTSRNRLKSSR